MIDQQRIFTIDQQSVVIEDFPAQGFILDIGGGGEGVIGQLKGPLVVAVDIIPNELTRSPVGPLKIIMDARELKFLDATFNTVTAFFAFMFIHPDDHARVFQEIFRVLTPGGQFMLWDIHIPHRPEPQKDMFVFPLQVILPTTVITTGYGTPYTEKIIDFEDYLLLAKKTRFRILKQNRVGQTFFCRAQKP